MDKTIVFLKLLVKWCFLAPLAALLDIIESTFMGVIVAGRFIRKHLSKAFTMILEWCES